MTWSGNQGASGYQLVDYRDEELAAKPVYSSPDDAGRKIWVTAPGANYGPWSGDETTTDWIRPASHGGSKLETDFVPIERMKDHPSDPAPAAVADISDVNGIDTIRKFDGVSAESLVIPWSVPLEADVSAGIKFWVEGYISEAVIPSSAEGVCFKLKGYAVRHDDPLNQAYGTEQESNNPDLDGLIQNDRFITDVSPTVVVTNLTKGTKAMLHFQRDPTDAVDTYAQDVGISGVFIQWAKAW